VGVRWADRHHRLRATCPVLEGGLEAYEPGHHELSQIHLMYQDLMAIREGVMGDMA
jgi:hypothetical protein